MADRVRVDAAVRRHSERVRRLLAHAGLGPSDTEDVLQETLLVFARRFDEVPEPAQRGFLVSTARRLAADWRRLAWNRLDLEPISGDLPDETWRTPDTWLHRREAHQLSLDALSVLPPEERSVLVLSRWSGQSREQIAEALQLPAGTVAYRLTVAGKHFDAGVRRLLDRGVDSLGPCHAPARGQSDVLVLPQAFGARDHGSYRYFNNQFGRSAARGVFDQCLVVRNERGKQQIGWSWRWPSNPWTLAYPEVFHGWSPWVGQGPGPSRLPVLVGRTRRLLVHYDVETRATGEHGLLMLVRLVAEPRLDGAKDPGVLTREIAVHLDGRFTVRALGRAMERTRITGVDHDFWLWRSFGGSDPAGLPSLVFSDGRSRSRGTVDMHELLRYLLQQGLASPLDWVACCELGNEVRGGAGTTWVKRFEVELET